MTRRRWIADEALGDRAALTGDQAAHLARVLRARVGQEFEIAANGQLRQGRIVSVAPDRVEFELGEPISAARLSHVVLALAVFKFDRMEWAIEKAAELGVSEILPVIAQRTDAHLAKSASSRAERWRRIAREAAQQSRRTEPPEIAGPVLLSEILERPAKSRIVLAESGERVPLRQALAGAQGPVLLAVGPEGGWTAKEQDSFRAHNWTPVSLGPTILRAETAAIAAVSIAMAELG